MSDRLSELLRIDRLTISESNKQRLHSCVTERLEAIELVIVIDSCVDQEELRDNLTGVIELLEYRHEVMLNCTEPDEFSERDHRKIIDRIQSLATKQELLSKKAAEDARQARRTPMQVLIESSKEIVPARRPRRSRKW